MFEPLQKTALSEPRTRLLELMQKINWGRIEGLRVVQGEPVFSPEPRVVRDHKLGVDEYPRSERRLRDFLVKSQLSDLFVQFERLGDGVIERLEVRNGLPFRMRVEERLEA